MGPARGTPDVECSHRELRAGLADRLCGDDTDRLAEVDHLAGRQVAPVALDAHAALGLAGQHGPDLDLLDAGGLDLGRQRLRNVLVHPDDGLARQRVLHVLERHAADDAIAQRLDDFATLDDRGHVDAVERVAVVARNDDVLRHVDQAAGQIARIGGLQRGVGQTLAGAVGRDEVLQHRQSLAEVRRDRGFDDFAGGLGHQAAHPGQLPDLLLAASGAGVRHDEDRVELVAALVLVRHLAEHLVGDALGDIRPDVDDLVVALTVGDGAVLVLLFHLDHTLARRFDQLSLVVGHDQVFDPDRNAGLGRMQEPEVLQIVQHQDGGLQAETEVAVVHQLLQSLPLHRAR